MHADVHLINLLPLKMRQNLQKALSGKFTNYVVKLPAKVYLWLQSLTESLRLEGSFGDHLVQLLLRAGSATASCSGLPPVGF